MKHERPANYPHYRKSDVTKKAFVIATHLGASPKEIQNALSQKQAQLPHTRK
jgi:hypothetical protein